MIHPMSVNQNRRSSSCRSTWYATSSVILTRKPPCTCTTPFGRPVVPDVYAMNRGCSESRCAGSHVERAQAVRESVDLAFQLSVGQRARRTVLTLPDERGALGRARSVLVDAVVGDVHFRAAEPDRPRDALRRLDDRAIGMEEL